MSTSSLKPILAAASLVVLAASAASAAGILTAKNGMTLYTLDKDKGGKPSCYGFCTIAWPPYLAASGDKIPRGWSQIKRQTGKLQWAYHGHPLYFYAWDRMKGDTKGNGLEGVWHVAKG